VTAGPADSPGFLLWRTTLSWQRGITAALRPLELTHVQFVLLASTWWLARHDATGGLPSQRQVADHAAADVMMSSQVLRVLEQRGLLTRGADPADARVKRLDVTAAGAALAERAIAVVETADAVFFGRSSDPDRLLAVLRELGKED
jgi:DNA-binding MarR family transcriptional regulator